MIGSFPLRKVLVYAFYILLFSTLQVSFPKAITLFGQVADLMFVFVVLTGYFFGFRDGVIIGLITGVLRDTFAGCAIIGLDGKLSITFGLGMLVLFLAGAIGSSFFTERMNRNIPFAFVSIMFTTLIYKLAGHLVGYAWTRAALGLSYGLSLRQIVLQSVLPQIAVNMIVALPILLLLLFLGPYSKEYRNSAKNRDVINSYGDDKWLTI